MRRSLLVIALIFAALMVVALEADDSLFVQVRESELRSAPGFLSQIVEKLSLGDELSYVGERAGWYQVTLPATDQSGWIHEGSVRENKETTLQLAGEGTTRTVSSREIALAGRGFSENMEGEYESGNELDFSAVDDLEARRVGPEEIVAFVLEASLRQDILQPAEE
ncbi:MAG: SH3 domain-containing protein [Spirochaetales bacterium]|nr:SH3 domain-containing protein [Spirochaetales bacterium]